LQSLQLGASVLFCGMIDRALEFDEQDLYIIGFSGEGAWTAICQYHHWPLNRE
jgi:hypothetical protein